MSKDQAINEALKRSKNHSDITYYIFYNDSIFNQDWRNRYQCSEWINRPNDNPKMSVYNGIVTEFAA